MGNLLDRIRNLKQKSEVKERKSFDEADQEFVQIAIRDLLDSSTAKDAQRLAVLMESLGRTEDDYTNTLEALKSAAVLAAKEQVYSQAMEGIDERAAKARERRGLLDNLSRRLIEPSTSSTWLANQAGRVRSAIENTRQKAQFAFDKNGSPIESFQRLIKKEVERQTDIWADRTAEANALMRDDEFFNLAEMCFAESYVVLGFTSDSEDETGKKLYFCLLYTSPSPRDQRGSRMPSSA